MMMLSKFRRRPDGIVPRHILALEYSEPSGLVADSVISSSVKSATEQPDIARIVLKLERFWLPSMMGMSWRQRLELLEVIDQELAATYPHGGVSQDISRKLILKAIESAEPGEINCLEQAILYFNSDNDGHRRAARAWLVLHRPDIVARLAPVKLGLGTEDRRKNDQRSAQRYEEDLAITVASDNQQIDGALLDLSHRGGRIALRPSQKENITAAPLAPGNNITVKIDFLAPQPAQVVWAASRCTGIAFR
jgi:hypothetical protein